MKDEILVRAGDVGEIIKVVRGDADGEVASLTAYHVHFDTLPGRLLLIPGDMLESLKGTLVPS
ncbi:MAG: hypothetical protein LBP68_08440 [Acidobacteriota bacterium]|nr:hypothetical protein [Acidobacteriota bacterium]